MPSEGSSARGRRATLQGVWGPGGSPPRSAGRPRTFAPEPPPAPRAKAPSGLAEHLTGQLAEQLRQRVGDDLVERLGELTRERVIEGVHDGIAEAVRLGLAGAVRVAVRARARSRRLRADRADRAP